MEKYTTDFNNTDIDSDLLNKIISSNDEIPETKHEEWMDKNNFAIRVLSVNDKPYEILSAETNPQYKTFKENLKCCESVFGLEKYGILDVTEQYSKKAYISPYKAPIILYKSKVYEARKTVFSSKKELEKYLKSEMGILVLEIFEREGKYMLRHFVSEEDNLKITLIGYLKMKIKHKLKNLFNHLKVNF